MRGTSVLSAHGFSLERTSISFIKTFLVEIIRLKQFTALICFSRGPKISMYLTVLSTTISFNIVGQTRRCSWDSSDWVSQSRHRRFPSYFLLQLHFTVIILVRKLKRSCLFFNVNFCVDRYSFIPQREVRFSSFPFLSWSREE